MGQETGNCVGASLAVLGGVVERGEQLQPPLDVRIGVVHFVDASTAL